MERAPFVILSYRHTIQFGRKVEIFDFSVNRSNPFEFTLGVRQIIPGWDEGKNMNVSGKREFIMRPQLAEGKTRLDEIIFSIQTVCKLKREISLVEPESLPNGGKVIDDLREYD